MQLAAFLTAMRTHYPQHYALVVLLAYTGLRFCHASALHWDDCEDDRGVLRVSRKQVRGKLGSVTRRKRAPKEYPVEPELAAILKEHRMHLLEDQAPGLANGLMFPSMIGTYRTPNSLDAALAKCLTAAQIGKRFTIHGLRDTFTDLVRLANVDAVVRRALTGVRGGGDAAALLDRGARGEASGGRRRAAAGTTGSAREGADAHVVHRGRHERLAYGERRDCLARRERLGDRVPSEPHAAGRANPTSPTRSGVPGGVSEESAR
jgi:hypothetical protein